MREAAFEDEDDRVDSRSADSLAVHQFPDEGSALHRQRVLIKQSAGRIV